MRLPTGPLHQFGWTYAARPLQQVQDLGGLAALAGPLAFVAPLGAFLAGVAFFPALAFLGATGARRGEPAAFFSALGSAAGICAGLVFSAIDFFFMFVFLWR